MKCISLCGALLLLPLAVGSAAADDAPVKLDIKLPKPVEIGTRKDIKWENLEAPRPAGYVPVVMVPPGTTNVALKKPVIASDREPIVGELAMVTDGNKDATDGSFVELGPGVQWVQIDLGRVYSIFAVAVWHYHSERRVYKDVVVQVADDPDFIHVTQTLYNSDHDNSSGVGLGRDRDYIETANGRVIEARGVKARYVRLSSKGNTSNDMNHYTEVEVYGKAP